MALAAQLYRDARAAERFRVGLDATLRDPEHMPIDVMVEDLSASGFRVLTATDLAVGVEIGLGLAGIGMHRAAVIWCEGGVCGCAFVQPLTKAVLDRALGAPSTAPVALPRVGPWGPVPVDANPDERPVRKLPIPVRLLVIVVLSVLAWLSVIALGLLVVRGRLF